MGGVRPDLADLGGDVGGDGGGVGQLGERRHDDAGLAEALHGPPVDLPVDDLALESQPSHANLRCSTSRPRTTRSPGRWCPNGTVRRGGTRSAG